MEKRHLQKFLKRRKSGLVWGKFPMKRTRVFPTTDTVSLSPCYELRRRRFDGLHLLLRIGLG